MEHLLNIKSSSTFHEKWLNQLLLKKMVGLKSWSLKFDIKSPGPDELKVTNHAIGLNYIDTYHRSGLYPLPLPSGIGLEAAGKVDEIGSNIKDFNKGDNIAYASNAYRSILSTKNNTCKNCCKSSRMDFT